METKKEARSRRARKTRIRITEQRATRLVVSRSNSHIYAQIIGPDGDKVLTSGGRVLCVTALGDTVSAAQQRAYQGVRQIRWQGCQYRSDIGYRAIAREQ